jgi:AraC family transcriptional regulator
LTPLAFEAIALQLLIALSRDSAPATRHAPAWLARVRGRLDDSPAAPVSLAELARIGGVHPAHLATTFRRCVGTSVGEYVRALRIEHARRALRTTDRSIADVALDCGFSDQSHLSRIFRKATGMAPARYRRPSRT